MIKIQLKDLFKTGLRGKIKYDEDQDCYMLETRAMAIGIMSEGFWGDWEDEEVVITIVKK